MVWILLYTEVTNHIDNMWREFPCNQPDQLLQQTYISFRISNGREFTLSIFEQISVQKDPSFYPTMFAAANNPLFIVEIVSLSQ